MIWGGLACFRPGTARSSSRGNGGQAAGGQGGQPRDDHRQGLLVRQIGRQQIRKGRDKAVFRRQGSDRPVGLGQHIAAWIMHPQMHMPIRDIDPDPRGACTAHARGPVKRGMVK